MVSDKAAKEAFVTGHSGADMSENVALILTVSLSTVWPRVLRGAAVRLGGLRNAMRAWPFAQRAFDAASSALPVLFCLTLGAPRGVSGRADEWGRAWAIYLSTTLMAVLVFAAWGADRDGVEASNRDGTRHDEETQGRRPAFVTAYRASVLLMTCVSILAVDFRVFPRRFSKSEEFGTSLMDGGVGSYIITQALLDRSALRVSKLGHVQRAWREFVRVWPLLALGTARLALIKAVSYQEHVSEYGVHWNFYFTLVALRVCTTVFAERGAVFGVVVLAGYQAILSTGLSEYVLHAPRQGIFSQNREGLVGVVGFFGTYCIARDVGRTIESGIRNKRTNSGMLLTLVAMCCVALAVTMLLDMFVQPVSRRLVNAAYAAWIHWFALLQLCFCLALQMGIGAGPHGALGGWAYDSLSRNQLATFVVANILVGLVNFSIDTLRAPPGRAVAVLALYVVASVLGGVGAGPWLRLTSLRQKPKYC